MIFVESSTARLAQDEADHDIGVSDGGRRRRREGYV